MKSDIFAFFLSSQFYWGFLDRLQVITEEVQVIGLKEIGTFY